MKKRRKATAAQTKAFTWHLLQKHFRGFEISQLVTSSRDFPLTARVELQKTLDQFISESADNKLIGVHEQWSPETLTIAKLWTQGEHAVLIGPLQYEEVDLGEEFPSRCLKQAVWLGHAAKTPFAVLFTPHARFGRSEGIVVEVAVPPGQSGLDFSNQLMARIEKAISEGRSYRGKVLSLESERSHSGKGGSIRVHKLRSVRRDEIILPEQTIALLERNITEFIRHRSELKRLNLGMKKGLLFYGPPGTGKTHTIHYLASQLPEHTTLLITGGQVGLLDEYMALARLLQPSIVVMEDVDLIARDRGDMHSPCEESLLNKLLNEMDGLREDAAVFFILTTNRPEQLESALAGRPGRIDQAIEFPLPNPEGRRKLATLYARSLELPRAVTEFIVKRTEGVSAAFIKELMRRGAQCMLQAGAKEIQTTHIQQALEELLFSGGSLNAKLLGAACKLKTGSTCGA
jgi:hypothetical protein